MNLCVYIGDLAGVEEVSICCLLIFVWRQVFFFLVVPTVHYLAVAGKVRTDLFLVYDQTVPILVFEDPHIRPYLNHFRH